MYFHFLSYCPFSKIAKSNGPYFVPISLKCVSYPLSPPKYNFRFFVCNTYDAHKVVFRLKLLPEKCRAGVAVILIESDTEAFSYQSNSVILSFGNPQYSKCSPTPNGQIILLTLSLIFLNDE